MAEESHWEGAEHVINRRMGVLARVGALCVLLPAVLLLKAACALPSRRHPHRSGPGGAGQAQGAEDGPAHAHQAPLHLRPVPGRRLHSPR